MAKTRIEVDEFLEKVSGISNLYFQPPETVKLKYPCIEYERSGISKRFANNGVYIRKDEYKVTVIDYDPDSEIAERFNNHPRFEFATHYAKSGLNHYVYSIFI